jgi:AbrB family looped-hinge helix DNA binding protein
MKCAPSLDELFFGTATVGDRGQVVIPAEARRKLGIHSGDKMLVLRQPHADGVVLCKIDAMREVFSSFLEDLERIESRLSESEG